MTTISVVGSVLLGILIIGIACAPFVIFGSQLAEWYIETFKPTYGPFFYGIGVITIIIGIHYGLYILLGWKIFSPFILLSIAFVGLMDWKAREIVLENKIISLIDLEVESNNRERDLKERLERNVINRQVLDTLREQGYLADKYMPKIPEKSENEAIRELQTKIDRLVEIRSEDYFTHKEWMEQKQNRVKK